uniref:E3 ubiquitin/ISG15 ligase TRIM25-like n=1 Tax=Erpetoichthys calabaricus TaxID=27687 RepID=A0A8C4T1V8_ERPCA
MAEAQFFVSQDEFTCSVCLEILSDPVTIPCGHSFCLKCLTDCWDQSQECSCPQCRETFMPRPELRRSTVLNEVIKKLKKTAISPRPLPQPQNYASPGDVECDFCTVNKFRAVKSCLTCMASYCQTHLQLHFEIAAWKDHKLVDPDGNLKEKLCVKHLKSLEIFCKTDETCVCLMCVVTGHKNHEIVELEMEREEKEKQLEVTLSDITRRLEEREKTLEETRRVMEQMRISFAREVEENEKSFNDLINYIMETHSKLTARIRKQEKREMKKAEGVLEQLGKEIQELKRRDAELQKLSDTKDHIRFLQTFSSLCVLPADGDSLNFTVTADFSSEDLRKEMSCLRKSVEKVSQWDIMSRTPSVRRVVRVPLRTTRRPFGRRWTTPTIRKGEIK